MTPGSSRFLMHRNLVIGFGWLVAILFFAANWMIAQRLKYGFFVVLAIVVISVAASILWWPWQLALIGWFVLPSASAGLLQASSVYRQGQKTIGANEIDVSTEHTDPSGDFSISQPMASPLIQW